MSSRSGWVGVVLGLVAVACGAGAQETSSIVLNDDQPNAEPEQVSDHEGAGIVVVADAGRRGPIPIGGRLDGGSVAHDAAAPVDAVAKPVDAGHPDAKPACTPKTFVEVCVEWSCGLLPDGCGGAYDCGRADRSNTGPYEWTCVSGVATCDFAKSCSNMGADCGPITCPGPRREQGACGTCSGGAACGGYTEHPDGSLTTPPQPGPMRCSTCKASPTLGGPSCAPQRQFIRDCARPGLEPYCHPSGLGPNEWCCGSGP